MWSSSGTREEGHKKRKVDNGLTRQTTMDSFLNQPSGGRPTLQPQKSAVRVPSDLSADSAKGELINLTNQTGPYEDAWDEFHVRMPCSPMNTYRVNAASQRSLPKWELIKSTLQQPIQNTKALRDAIYTYNPRYIEKCDFTGLRFFFTKVLDATERQLFFSSTLPFMANLACSLPDLFKKPLPFLMKFLSSEILLSQHQVACLIANMFFCTFPNRSDHHYSNDYPNCNFNLLYAPPCDKMKQGKLRCIIHYFERISRTMPIGNLSFKRQVMEDFPEDWEECDNLITTMKAHADGTIEDNGLNMLQVDFANKFIGGGVLSHGCVQEEIRFVINPELMVSRIFTAEIQDNEAVIMKGAERYSFYTGYSKSFQWVSTYIDETPRDSLKRINTEIVAIDALQLKNPVKQYSEEFVLRELNKAYAGFFQSDESKRTPIASGFWGCGAFGGSKQLKSLLQIIAASQAGRELHFFTFQDIKFANKLTHLHNLLITFKITTGQLSQCIFHYAKSRLYSDQKPPSLFKYIISKLDPSDETQEPF